MGGMGGSAPHDKIVGFNIIGIMLFLRKIRLPDYQLNTSGRIQHNLSMDE